MRKRERERERERATEREQNNDSSARPTFGGCIVSRVNSGTCTPSPITTPSARMQPRLTLLPFFKTTPLQMIDSVTTTLSPISTPVKCDDVIRVESVGASERASEKERKSGRYRKREKA